ncbi:hypothetical protein C8D87_1148 [Lentzea atacamensis]|uniref:Uncharacterized protein n=1 Tax=Lentzea atacamensis TaxID=531938 RepID=A0ABX9DVS9_9PSEU|nr:hypothetical protein [Lentzea atacamensis]RAS59396.1 hypothetical protein C8D87_1148 [Lentzea atacamensis]
MTIDTGVVSPGQAAVQDGLAAAAAAFTAAREQLGPDATDAELRKHADWLLLRSRTELLDPDRIAIAAEAFVRASGGVWDALLPDQKTPEQRPRGRHDRRLPRHGPEPLAA